MPRSYILPDQNPIEISLHKFCDASNQAYAAVTYFRFRLGDGTIETKFVCSKNRVAPLTANSIPRLELQAALIGSRLARTVREQHEYPISKRTFWTDSKTVWIRIKSDPINYHAFVSHRLAEIDELTDTDEWKWTPTHLNPTDQATKATNTPWSEDDQWFSRPEFLKGTSHG